MLETAERHLESEAIARESASPGVSDAELETDLQPWRAIAGLIIFLAFLITALIGLCFLVAKLVTGHAV